MSGESYRIFLLGIGGTGSYIARDLARMAKVLGNVQLIFVDGDLVADKNIDRQNFTPEDVGRNKAEVTAARYSAAFGTEIQYIPEFCESKSALLAILDGGQDEHAILIGAVDNDRSRKVCCEAFCAKHDLIYIDAGNGDSTGQVVCGIRRHGRTIYQCAPQIYPEMLQTEDLLPSEQSCADATVSAPQTIAANLLSATAVLLFLYNILYLGDTHVRRLTFSARDICMTATHRKKRKQRRHK